MICMFELDQIARIARGPQGGELLSGLLFDWSVRQELGKLSK